MGAPIGNKNAEGNNGGNPGYGTLATIKDKVKKHLPEWWEAWSRDMKSEKFEERKVAMQEFNKLQVKLMPTTLSNDEEKPITIQFNGIFETPQEASGDNKKQ